MHAIMSWLRCNDTVYQQTTASAKMFRIGYRQSFHQDDYFQTSKIPLKVSSNISQRHFSHVISRHCNRSILWVYCQCKGIRAKETNPLNPVTSKISIRLIQRKINRYDHRGHLCYNASGEELIFPLDLLYFISSQYKSIFKAAMWMTGHVYPVHDLEDFAEDWYLIV